MTRAPDRRLLSYLASHNPHVSSPTPALREIVLEEAPDAIESVVKGHAGCDEPNAALLVEDALATERYAREDRTLVGVTIPRGELVLAVLVSANPDQQQFEEPDKLDLARDPNRHLALGYGVHCCLGGPLARLEGPRGVQLTRERHAGSRQF